MALQKGLGKGLSALLEEQNIKNGGISGINIHEISPNPNQPRQFFNDESLADLSDSIRENGVISPITLRKLENGYEIIAGERRWRAARLAGLTSIPAVVLDVDVAKAYQIAMIENLQREDLNPIEEAKGYRRLMDEYAMTQEQVATAVSKSRPAVANAVRLLDLPEALLSAIEGGTISAGHGRALLALKDSNKMKDALKEIVARSLSVRATEELISNWNNQQKKSPKINPEKIYINELERKVTNSIGRKISITKGKKRGKLYIEFYGNADLEALIDSLSKLSK